MSRAQPDETWEYGYHVDGTETIGGDPYVQRVDGNGKPLTAETASMRGGIVMRRRPAIPAGPWEPIPEEER